jgi:hypothetical protein
MCTILAGRNRKSLQSSFVDGFALGFTRASAPGSTQAADVVLNYFAKLFYALPGKFLTQSVVVVEFVITEPMWDFFFGVVEVA